MNKAFSCSPWYEKEDLLKAVNMCMDALERSGISAERVKLVPECLTKAIECSNDIAMSQAPFVAAPVSVERDGACFKVLPFGLESY